MRKYEVGLWCGSGYQLTTFEVDADCEESALEKAIVQAENESLFGLFFDECDDLES